MSLASTVTLEPSEKAWRAQDGLTLKRLSTCLNQHFISNVKTGFLSCVCITFLSCAWLSIPFQLCAAVVSQNVTKNVFTISTIKSKSTMGSMYFSSSAVIATNYLNTILCRKKRIQDLQKLRTLHFASLSLHECTNHPAPCWKQRNSLVSRHSVMRLIS